MHHWKKAWYTLIGPLWIWVVFIIFVPFLLAGAIVSLSVLPPVGDTLIKTASLFCVMILAPLAALAEIAPPFVTKEEVNWRNRNTDELFEGDVAWEDIPFLPPVLKRIRATTSRRRRQEKRENETSIDAKPSIT
ncbi:hypothetical protein RHSP_41130 (plasmid) [Rhizobium freirei PRF 81]|uniref:Transmembrane protein n=1 Tax=Rhizobium freirei PRF 81 TaxID=363754 RepID=N6USK6_9HYPH|nr:hypothetical protein [Rhizobium freirei]ENN83801.1 hypothetical protein RHSP_41130 [Rhizobium freirei PRF 81]